MMVEARNLECVRGQRRLFENLNFSMSSGDCIELRGPNGSGKTSLLRILCGLLPASSGVILWNGESIHTLREDYLASLTYVGHRCAVKNELTALENLRVSTALSGFELSPEDARGVLRRMSLHDQGELKAHYLSEGQRRRLALARLLCCRASLWLLDEVLTSLDDTAASLITTLIDDHISRGGMVVIATHQELKLGARISRRIELAA